MPHVIAQINQLTQISFVFFLYFHIHISFYCCTLESQETDPKILRSAGRRPVGRYELLSGTRSVRGMRSRIGQRKKLNYDAVVTEDSVDLWEL